MKTKTWGILAAVTASSCCLGPLVVAILGLGSLGLGSMLAKYHGHLLALSFLLLLLAWRSYFQEQRACRTKHCPMRHKRLTQGILIVASLIFFVFSGLSVYRILYNPPLSSSSLKQTPPAYTTELNLRVEGMSCATCEWTLEHALKQLKGVYDAKASAKHANVRIWYDKSQISQKTLQETILKAGYKPVGFVRHRFGDK